MIKRKKQYIEALQDEAGNWVTDQEELKQMASKYFQNLYTKDEQVLDSSTWIADFPPLLQKDVDLIHKEVEDTEIKNAAFMMGALKAPGPDGLQAHFFQSQWNHVGRKVCDLIHEIWQNPMKIKEINHTSIVLIPKVDNPQNVNQFRPISLCNVIFKIITKIIANRLKSAMSYLIKPQQCSFIAGRQSSDNIIIAQEAVHTMRTKARKTGYVAIKVDMEKAYDRLDWDFLKTTLSSMGLRDQMVNLIMACTSLVSMKVLWNGAESSLFVPTRGLRQGDPLSPYLFILCMERLGHLISREVRDGNWKGLKFNRSAPTVSHLFFADDLLLFGEASTKQMEVMQRVMKGFCEVSGHRINLSKSKAFFSKNVHINRALDLGNRLGIGITGDLGKYLGVPLLHKRVNKLIFLPIIQKARRRLASWKSRFLTMAGRTVLVKSVLAALPTYQMQTTLLPRSVLKELEQISRSFLWNQGQEGRKMHLIAWDQVKQAKELGGLGIRDLQNQNIAFIMKLCWGLLTKPEALWVQCLKGKYGCGEEIYPMVYKKQNSSRVWQSITTVWERFYKGIGRSLKDGKTSNAWWDLWTSLDEPLIHFVDRNIHLLDPCAKVSDFVTDNGRWNIQKWREFLRWLTSLLK